MGYGIAVIADIAGIAEIGKPKPSPQIHGMPGQVCAQIRKAKPLGPLPPWIP
jgi:hypothetical protein